MSVMYGSVLANTYSKFLFEGEGIKYSITTGCFKNFFWSAGHFFEFSNVIQDVWCISDAVFSVQNND